jgi:hypothetical protein
MYNEDTGIIDKDKIDQTESVIPEEKVEPVEPLDPAGPIDKNETNKDPFSATQEIESQNPKEKIQLTNDEKYEFDDISIYGNVMTIRLDEKVDMTSLLEDMSIFNVILILTRSETVCAEYHSFNTVYKKDEETNTLWLSNDESIYIAPEEPDISTPSEPEKPAEPTLDEIKNAKIEEISEACNFNIVHGAYMEVDGKMQLFSYKPEDQSNLISALQLSIATQMSMPYHADGENCRLFTPEEITTLYVNEMTNLTHHQTYTNQMKMYINSLENKEDIESIFYGVELTGEYLDTYNMIMEQSKLVVQKYLETLTGVTAPDENGECTKTDEDTDLGFTESEGEGESTNSNTEGSESTENTNSENTEISDNL